MIGFEIASRRHAQAGFLRVTRMTFFFAALALLLIRGKVIHPGRHREDRESMGVYRSQ